MNRAAALTVVAFMSGFALTIVGSHAAVYEKDDEKKLAITLFIITVITGALAAGLGVK